MGFQCQSALVTLATPNLETLVQFYRQLLAQAPEPYIPNVYGEFQLPGLRLGIFKPKESHFSEFVNTDKGCFSLCLEVNDLESAISHLSALGYPPAGDILTASHGREIYAYDPIGNRLILHESGKSSPI